MAGIVVGLKVDTAHILGVCSLRLAVYGALVQFRVFACSGVDRVDVRHGHLLVENLWKTPLSTKFDYHPGWPDLGLALNEFSRSPIQPGSFQEQPIDIDALLGAFLDVLPVVLGDHILQHHRIQSPSLMCPSNILESNVLTVSPALVQSLLVA